ncbi:MAG: sodium:solute symporter family protein [Acidobacteriota bacterium]|nr:sodium:solute symporter family protein [Acidobacteriota bacterium]
MTLAGLDWAILVVFLMFPFLIAISTARRSGQNLAEYFLAGRQLPWWLAGTSMVATTFAADTPLAVAGLVATNGVAGNWIWWNGALGSTLSVLFFARLWRRSGVVSDVAFVELRYSGRAAQLLRGFRALYLGLPINCMIIGWVNLAMAKILNITLGWDRLTAVFAGLALTAGYVTVSGLRGVVFTDLVQFGLAMSGTIAVAYFALMTPAVGGLDGLTDKLPEATFRVLPALGDASATSSSTLTLSLSAFVAYLGVQWWASWYPGQEPGGGGYLAQRMLSARNERHALLATGWFTVAHYCVRPWPWVLTGLAALILYPDLPDPEAGYAMVIRDHLPVGWRGLVLGGFVAAFMSTMSTQLNWGASYLVQDVYARFVRPDADDRHYVRAARVATLTIMVASAGVTLYLETIRQAWELILESGAGIGLVLILRWYWWRVNAWSEMAAMIAPVVGHLALSRFTTVLFPESLLYLVVWTSVCWLAVTWLTPPEPDEVLAAFYTKVRPGGPGWRPVTARLGLPYPEPIGGQLLEWLAWIGLVYGTLLGVGALLLPTGNSAAPYLATAVVCGVLVGRFSARGRMHRMPDR